MVKKRRVVNLNSVAERFILDRKESKKCCWFKWSGERQNRRRRIRSRSGGDQMRICNNIYLLKEYIKLCKTICGGNEEIRKKVRRIRILKII